MLPAEQAAPLKLLEKGVSKEALAGLVLLEFPCELASAVLAGRWASSPNPFTPFMMGYKIRLVMAAAVTLVVSHEHKDVFNKFVWLFMLSHCLSVGVCLHAYTPIHSLLHLFGMVINFATSCCLLSLKQCCKAVQGGLDELEPLVSGQYSPGSGPQEFESITLLLPFLRYWAAQACMIV